MAFVNDNYCNLKDSYLFSQIAQKVNAYVAEHPEKKVIRMGIGDVTLPLAPAVIDAMQKAVAEMGVKETFRGYGPEQGYDFLHEAIVKYYAGFGVTLASDEIFISDGAKSDCGNITDIFSNANTILIPDPVYPVYLDTNIMCGRKIVYMDGKPENNFLPMPDDSVKADIIYLCSPNNPTGNVFPAIEIERLITAFDGIVVVDEAYIDFSSRPSWIRRLNEFHNLVVLQTFSKAWGSAGVRLGMAFASTEIIGILSKIKYPYNVNQLTQKQAIEMLHKYYEIERWVKRLKEARENLENRFSELPLTVKVFPSDANFFLARVTDAVKIYNYLVGEGIIVRNRNSISLCGNCLRVTVGTRMENDKLIEALKSYE